MAIDIFKPQQSVVVKGLEGKMILIYGTNRTGKTYNAVQSQKPFVVAFERGLNAISGVNYVPISKWSEWIETVKQLTGAQMAQAKEVYNTIIIDTIDAMGSMASEYVCAKFGVNRIGEGNRGYGLWKEYSDEIEKWLRTLTNAGYTLIFIGHEGSREFHDTKGEKYDKIYPAGDKRVVDPILNLVDFIAYAQPQPQTEQGQNVNSTLYLVGNTAFHAGSRFTAITPVIPEWTMDKLETAISEAVEAEEKKTGRQSVTFKEYQTTAAEAAKSVWADLTFDQVKAVALEKGTKFIETVAGGNPEKYKDLLFAEFGTRDFSITNSTPQQRDLVEQLLNALVTQGL